MLEDKHNLGVGVIDWFKIYVNFINVFSLTGLDISLIHCFCRNFDNWWLSWGLKIKKGLKR